MPTFGTDVAAIAWPALKAVGGLTEVTFSTVTTVIDTVTGAVTETVTSETVDAKVSPFRPDELAGLGVTMRDRKVLFPVAAVVNVPNTQARITIDGVIWHMQAPPELVSNGGLWQLQVRRVGDA